MNRVLVQGQGYKKISDVGTERYEIWNGSDYALAKVVSKTVNSYNTIKFCNGHEVSCDDKTEFFARHWMGQRGWTKLEDLTKHHFVAITESTPKFDFFPKDRYKILGKGSSFSIGILLGLWYFCGKEVTNGIDLTIPELDFEVRRLLTNIFNSLEVKVNSYEKYKLNGNFVIYEIRDPNLLLELQNLTIDFGFCEDVWASKVVIEGILRIAVEYAEIYQDNFRIKVRHKSKELTKDLQHALLLFGVMSHITKGFLRTWLSLSGRNALALCKNVGTITPEKVLDAVKLEKLSRNRKTKPPMLKICEILLTTSPTKLYDVIDSEQFAVNGLVTRQEIEVKN